MEDILLILLFSQTLKLQIAKAKKLNHKKVLGKARQWENR